MFKNCSQRLLFTTVKHQEAEDKRAAAEGRCEKLASDLIFEKEQYERLRRAHVDMILRLDVAKDDLFEMESKKNAELSVLRERLSEVLEHTQMLESEVHAMRKERTELRRKLSKTRSEFKKHRSKNAVSQPLLDFVSRHEQKQNFRDTIFAETLLLDDVDMVDDTIDKMTQLDCAGVLMRNAAVKHYASKHRGTLPVEVLSRLASKALSADESTFYQTAETIASSISVLGKDMLCEIHDFTPLMLMLHSDSINDDFKRGVARAVLCTIRDRQRVNTKYSAFGISKENDDDDFVRSMFVLNGYVDEAFKNSVLVDVVVTAMFSKRIQVDHWSTICSTLMHDEKMTADSRFALAKLGCKGAVSQLSQTYRESWPVPQHVFANVLRDFYCPDLLKDVIKMTLMYICKRENPNRRSHVNVRQCIMCLQSCSYSIHRGELDVVQMFVRLWEELVLLAKTADLIDEAVSSMTIALERTSATMMDAHYANNRRDRADYVRAKCVVAKVMSCEKILKMIDVTVDKVDEMTCNVSKIRVINECLVYMHSIMEAWSFAPKLILSVYIRIVNVWGQYVADDGSEFYRRVSRHLTTSVSFISLQRSKYYFSGPYKPPQHSFLLMKSLER